MKFLVIIGIILGIFFLIVTFVFRVLRDIVKVIIPNSARKSSKQPFGEDVIYSKNDVVILKGDAHKSQDQ